MEWLRSVDLAEYAPNLRGSGVHGGLMVRGEWAGRICQLINEEQSENNLRKSKNVVRKESSDRCTIGVWGLPLELRERG